MALPRVHFTPFNEKEPYIAKAGYVRSSVLNWLINKRVSQYTLEEQSGCRELADNTPNLCAQGG